MIYLHFEEVSFVIDFYGRGDVESVGGGMIKIAVHEV